MEFLYNIFSDYVTITEDVDVPVEHDDPPGDGSCVIA